MIRKATLLQCRVVKWEQVKSRSLLGSFRDWPRREAVRTELAIRRNQKRHN